jgi:hypothetical protein
MSVVELLTKRSCEEDLRGEIVKFHQCFASTPNNYNV